jgi:hypothetical protein
VTLFVVQARGTDAAALVRAHFIKDGFAWGGFVFGWLWLAYHRLWLATAIYLAFEVLVLVLVRPHVEPPVLLVLDALARLFVGLEGNRLREAKGARRAALTDVIEARDRPEAETIFYARHAGGAA